MIQSLTLIGKKRNKWTTCSKHGTYKCLTQWRRNQVKRDMLAIVHGEIIMAGCQWWFWKFGTITPPKTEVFHWDSLLTLKLHWGKKAIASGTPWKVCQYDAAMIKRWTVPFRRYSNQWSESICTLIASRGQEIWHCQMRLSHFSLISILKSPLVTCHQT